MREPLPSYEIWHGGDFALLCEWRRLTRIVEIGVDRGEFANVFLSRIINCEVYIGVDPYLGGASYPEMPWDREADFQAACIRFERHANRAKLLRTDSISLASKISATRELINDHGDLSFIPIPRLYSDLFDLVYIDGAHQKDAVLSDMESWWPLISSKGILAGHDWSMASGDHPQVQAAVREFAKQRDLQIFYTTADDPRSWYIYKNGIPDSDWRRC